MMPDIGLLPTPQPYSGHDLIVVANGSGLAIHHTGSSSLSSASRTLRLSNILHVPSLSKSLLSASLFIRDNNVFFEFHPFFFVVKDLRSGMEVLCGPLLMASTVFHCCPLCHPYLHLLLLIVKHLPSPAPRLLGMLN